jgi:hypothetical protein
MSVARIDVDGTMFPRWEVELAELEALGVGDPETDRAGPTEADFRWAAEFLELPPLDDGPSDQDLEDAYLESLWHDRLEAMHRVTDEDIRACGLAVG